MTGRAAGDALVVTRAMKASTIAEIFVQEGHVRVEVEIGVEDLSAFQNVLPDEIFEKLTGVDTPLENRLPSFLKNDWVLRADDRKLEGSIEQIVPAKRLVRDEVTGAPVANQPDDAEIVIRVELHYALDGQPNSLFIRPPLVGDNKSAAANIGFVAYHRGVAVNDFRYLSQEETLQLDWSDPWYSAFERKTLKRRYFAPAAAFLYIENFEVRKEVIFRPKDLQRWVDLGLEDTKTIKVTDREAICEKAAVFLAEHTPVEIDGKPTVGTLDRVHFIERTLRSSGVVEPDKDVDINTALIGAIYVYPVESLPQQVTMGWDLFNDRITSVPTVASDEAGGMPSALDADDPLLVWQNFLTNPTTPAFMSITPPSQPTTILVPLISILCLAGIVILWLRSRSRLRACSRYLVRPILYTVLLGMIAYGATFWPRWQFEISLTDRKEITAAEANDVAYSLLHNVYRAFDYRDDGMIYDVLSRSVSGDLLTQIYLEMRQSLTLASQGGARVKVQEVDLVACTMKPIGDEAFLVDCQWTATGSVGHWGHIHQRTNQYHGEFHVRAVDGQWKFTNMELLDEERL